MIGVLAATGLRISEALSLQLTDVTPGGLLIRKTKFQKTRLVPLHDTVQSRLDRYLTCRRQVMATGKHVFVTDDGRPGPARLSGDRPQNGRVFLVTSLGIRRSNNLCSARW